MACVLRAIREWLAGVDRSRDRLRSAMSRLRRWWWARTGRECVACGFSHPYPERWHSFPYRG